MGNSESRSPNDQVSPSTCSPHEDGCKEAEIKLIECAITLPEVKELATKGLIEAFKDAGLHDKYLENVEEQMSKAAVKELESIFPGESKEWALGVHKYFMKGKGGCCKEQYTAYTDCMIEKLCEEEQCGPFVTTITKMLFRFL